MGFPRAWVSSHDYVLAGINKIQRGQGLELSLGILRKIINNDFIEILFVRECRPPHPVLLSVFLAPVAFFL